MSTTDDDLARSLMGKGFLDAAAFVAPPSPGARDGLPGKPFGKYRVLRKLGEGGSSRVYLALDPLLHRRVALKVLKDAAPEEVERFAREARLTAELSHPNIVRVHEVGRVGRKPYLAMDWIDGRPVGPTDPLRAVRMLLPIARALEAAHRRGMIHRDVKPGNILVDAAGRAWLADFGMARHVVAGRGESLTCSGTFLGTPAFMSPEQARGETRRLTAATDVFSLGSTLYFVATGRLPYDGQSPLEVVRSVVETLPRPLREIAPKAPRGLEEIVARAMAPDPADRYATAGPMADDLERLLQGVPPVAVRRRWAWPAAAAAAVLAAGILAGGFRSEPAAPAPTPPAKAPASESLTEQPGSFVRPAPPPRPVPAELPPARSRVDPALRERILRLLEAPAALRRPFLGDAEARRAVELLSAGELGEADVFFLRERAAGEAARGLEEERRFLAAEQARLDARAAERPDIVVTEDGRAYTGRILDEPLTGVVLLHDGKPRFFPKENVRSLSRDATREAGFARRLAAALAEPAPDLAGLARGCEEEGLRPHRDAVLFRLLARDPSDVALRTALGFRAEGPLHASPRTVAPARTLAYEGETFTPEELERTLRERNFVVVDGAWCALQEWRWAPDEPWNGRVLAAASGDVGPRTWEDVRVEKAYDVAQLKLVEVRRSAPLFRYVGAPPTASGGRAVIDVRAPGPLVECRVTAAAEIVQGRRGSVRAFVVTPGGTSSALYALEALREESAHDVSEAVRGRDRFSIVADLDGAAVFLPSTVEAPLAVDGKVAVRHEALTRLLPPR